jgi:PAS domain S-box-containing protein
MTSILDVRTVVFSYVISNLICMVVIAVLWRHDRRHFPGLGFWLADFVIQWGAVLLIALRGWIPDVLSMTGSNTLIVGGTVLLYEGLSRFVGRRVAQVHNVILVGVFSAAHAFLAFVQPNLTARTILLSLALLGICGQCAWLLLRQVDRELRSITGEARLVLVLFCLVSIVRIAIDLDLPAPSDFFHSSIYDTLVIILYQMLFVSLTFALVLMVNRRLVLDLRRDVAMRQQAEQALRASEADFREVFDNTAHGIFIINVAADGTFRIGNSNTAEEIATTFRREDVIGKSLVEVLPADTARALQANYSRCLEAGSAIAYEEEVDLPGVGRRHFLTTLAPVRDESGRFYRIIGSTLEITDRKQKEDALRLSEEKFHKAFHSSPYALMLTRHSDGWIVEANEGLTGFSGYSRAELIGQTTIDLRLWESEEQRAAMASELAAEGVIHGREYLFRRRSGEIIVGLFSADILLINGEKHILSSLSDISERKRTEMERERLIGDLEDALARVRQLSGMLPICASCKSIRDDKGYWTKIEAYLRDHSEVDFSHGLCPTCARKLYPELYNK